MTEESGDREKKPRRREGSVPVIAVIWQGDIRDWKAAVLWLCICDTHTNSEITVSSAGL